MKLTSESKENLVSSSSSAEDLKNQDDGSTDPNGDRYNDEYILSPIEKNFLLTAERGDCAGIRR